MREEKKKKRPRTSCLANNKLYIGEENDMFAKSHVSQQIFQFS